MSGLFSDIPIPAWTPWPLYPGDRMIFPAQRFRASELEARWGPRPLNYIYPNYYTAMQEQREANPQAAERRDREQARAVWLRDHPGPRLAEGRRYGRE